MIARISYTNNNIILALRYHAAFIAKLKASIPASYRAWDSTSKTWTITSLYADTLLELLAEFGIQVQEDAARQQECEAEVSVQQAYRRQAATERAEAMARLQQQEADAARQGMLHNVSLAQIAALESTSRDESIESEVRCELALIAMDAEACWPACAMPMTNKLDKAAVGALKHLLFAKWLVTHGILNEHGMGSEQGIASQHGPAGFSNE